MEEEKKLERYEELIKGINALEKDSGLFKALKRVDELEDYRED